jgi:SpoVK/Ycf46/Vps4 family AAA+-type ATPase
MLEDNARGQGQAKDKRYRWDALIIPQDTLKKLETLCKSLSSVDISQKQEHEPPHSALLYGPPGTVATQIARTFAVESGRAFFEAGSADLKACYVGRKWRPVRDLFEKARGHAPSILFIDELDSSAPARGSGYADPLTDEIVAELLSAMDDSQSSRHVFFLAATNYPERIDPAILSRFTEKIEIVNSG